VLSDPRALLSGQDPEAGGLGSSPNWLCDLGERESFAISEPHLTASLDYKMNQMASGARPIPKGCAFSSMARQAQGTLQPWVTVACEFAKCQAQTPAPPPPPTPATKGPGFTHTLWESQATEQHLCSPSSSRDLRVFFVFLGPYPYGGSQAKGQIGAVTTGLHHSHMGSELRMQPTPQLTATADP